MSKGYVAEKLIIGMETLAASDRPLRERMFDAWISGICRLEESDFTDPDQKERFAELSKAASQVEGDKGAFSATPENELKIHAEEMCRLLWELDRA